MVLIRIIEENKYLNPFFYIFVACTLSKSPRLMKKSALLVFIFIVISTLLRAQRGFIYTTVGTGVQGFYGDGGPATAAELYGPANLVFDKKGNMFIADQWNNRIRRVDASTGYINTVAGDGTLGYGGDNGPADLAKLNQPASLVVDASDNIYIADFCNNRVRVVTDSNGYIYTIAGTGLPGYSGDGGQATAAKIDHPHHVSLDKKGNLYIADEYSNCIRKVVLSTGIISTVAGNGHPGFSGDNGYATAAMLNGPKCVNLDDSGNMYIADYLNNRIRKVRAKDSIVLTIAGNGEPGFSGDSGLATLANVNSPYRVITDSVGNFYFAGGNDNRIRWVNSGTGRIYTFAGNGIAGFSGDGGPADDAELDFPPGLAINTKGNICIADFRNNRVREVLPVADSSINNSINVAPEISIYPNPTGTETWVHISGTYQGISLVLYNLVGQKIWKTNEVSYNSLITVPLDQVYAGMYLLRIQIGTSDIRWKKIEVIR
jgi:hypothetical protein